MDDIIEHGRPQHRHSFALSDTRTKRGVSGDIEIDRLRSTADDVEFYAGSAQLNKA